jgi:hypothetical protein
VQPARAIAKRAAFALFRSERNDLVTRKQPALSANSSLARRDADEIVAPAALRFVGAGARASAAFREEIAR